MGQPAVAFGLFILGCLCLAWAIGHAAAIIGVVAISTAVVVWYDYCQGMNHDD